MADLQTPVKAWLRVQSEEDLVALIESFDLEGYVAGEPLRDDEGCIIPGGVKREIDGVAYHVPVAWAMAERQVRKLLRKWENESQTPDLEIHVGQVTHKPGDVGISITPSSMDPKLIGIRAPLIGLSPEHAREVARRIDITADAAQAVRDAQPSPKPEET